MKWICQQCTESTKDWEELHIGTIQKLSAIRKNYSLVSNFLRSEKNFFQVHRSASQDLYS